MTRFKFPLNYKIKTKNNRGRTPERHRPHPREPVQAQINKVPQIDVPFNLMSVPSCK